MNFRTLMITVLIAGLTLVGCSSNKSNGLQFNRQSEQWVCLPNEAREDWDCVQDNALAKSKEQGHTPSKR